MKRAILLALAAATAGCATAREAADTTARAVKDVIPGPRATAELRDAQGRGVGTVKMVQEVDGLKVDVEAMNLAPGLHGIHIHSVGSCTAPGFTSAGGHFNPEGHQHGFDNPQGPHAGDLRNLEIGSDGRGEKEYKETRVSLNEGMASLLDADGSAVVIHAAADDYRTDPSGNSGARVACGVVTRS